MAVKEKVSDDALQEFYDFIGGEAGLRALFDDAGEGHQYADANREALTERYPDEWIALRRDQVVGHAPDLETLWRALTRDGVDRRGVVFQRMETEPLTLLL